MKTISLKDYEPSGAGVLGESYISRSNPNILLKLYSREREQLGLDEYDRACKVFRLGVSCPAPGELVRTEDGLLGIQFHRIIGKKSYARALSEHPERFEEYAVRFADECKRLHSIRPETVNITSFDLDLSSLPKSALERKKDSLEIKMKECEVFILQQIKAIQWSWTYKVSISKIASMMFWERQYTLPWGQKETYKEQLVKIR